MGPEQAGEQLKRVIIAYPSIREFLASTDRGGTKNETFIVWCKMLSGCDERHVTEVVDEIVAGQRAPWSRFQKPDTVARNILEEASSRRNRSRQRESQQKNYLDAIKSIRENSPRFAKAWRASCALGRMVRDGKISKEENGFRMRILSAWFETGCDEPDWRVLLAQGKPQ